MKKAVVIPCYKAAKSLPYVLERIPRDLIDYIIVVDDKCPDNSGRIAKKLMKDGCIVIFHENNLGVGGAVISGYLKALELGVRLDN